MEKLFPGMGLTGQNETLLNPSTLQLVNKFSAIPNLEEKYLGIHAMHSR